MQDVLDLLMGLTPPKLPEKQSRLKRLSKECGADVIFTLRALPYNRVAEIREGATGDVSVEILLAGVSAPNLKDKGLMDKYHAPTPAELVKTLLLPGEIEALAREVEKLSGYRTTTVEDVKKN